MKRETISMALNALDDRFISEAAAFRPKAKQGRAAKNTRKKNKQILSLALAAALLLALGTAAYAVYRWRLQDLLLESPAETETQTREPRNFAPLPADADVISLQGYTGSPEYKAMLEWSEFRQSYDLDGVIRTQSDNAHMSWEDSYSGYGVYSQEMADRLDAIAEKYGLTIHSGGVHATSTMAELYERFGRFCAADKYYGYYYDDGTFQCDCTYDGLMFQLRRCMKGTVDGVGLNIIDVELYEQWEYQSAGGVTVLIALGANKALIVADLPESFVVVNVVDFREPLPGESLFSQQEIEALADSIDFSIL